MGIFGGKRTSDKSCAQHRGSKEIAGRMEIPKADGVASSDRTGVREHHRGTRLRTCADEFGRVMEQLAGEVGQDGKREYNVLKGKSAKVQKLVFVEGSWWNRRCAEVHTESPLARGRMAGT